MHLIHVIYVFCVLETSPIKCFFFLLSEIWIYSYSYFNWLFYMKYQYTVLQNNKTDNCVHMTFEGNLLAIVVGEEINQAEFLKRSVGSICSIGLHSALLVVCTPEHFKLNHVNVFCYNSLCPACSVNKPLNFFVFKSCEFTDYFY